jgi:hypothetical protein
MPGKKRAMIVLIGSALVAIGAIALISAARAGAATTTPPIPMDPGILTQAAHRTPISGNGVPAIKPHLSGNGPSFTAADARAFVVANGIPRFDIRGPINVTVATFGSVANIQSTYLHGNLSDDPSRLICFVEIQNTIFVPAPPGGKGGPFSHGFVYFDAHTGNELGAGAFN